jgi:hypothetical protein
MDKNFKALIKLSPFQVYDYYLASCGDYVTFNLGIIRSSQGTKLENDHFKKALVFMQERHPLLRAHIEHDTTNPRDVYLVFNQKPRDIDLDWTSDVNSREEMVKEVEKFNNRRFNFRESCLLLRAICIEFTDSDGQKKYAISFRMISGLTEGLNMCALLIETMNIVQALVSGTECEEMKTKLDFVENVHAQLIKNNLFTEDLQKEVDRLNGEKREHPQAMSIEKFKSSNEKGAKIDLIRFDKQQTASFISKCKRNNQKLTAPLTALFFKSLREIFVENSVDFPKEVSFGLPVCLRFRYQPKMDLSHITHQIIYTEINLDYSNESIFDDPWFHSDKIRKQVEIHADLSKSHMFFISHNFKFLDEANTTLYDLLADVGFDGTSESLCQKVHDLEARSSRFSISNIGKWVYDDKKTNLNKGAFQIDELYIGDTFTSTPAIGNILECFVSYWNDELDILISSNKSAFSSAYSNRFAQIFTDNFSKLLNS